MIGGLVLPLNNPDLDRLGKLLGMLGSEHDGERAAAGLKADQLIRDRGTSWSALIDNLKVSNRPPEKAWTPPRPQWSPWPEPVTPLRKHQRDARECACWSHLLNEWERGFIADMAQSRSISTKQADKLAVILAKVRRLRPDAEEF